MGITGEAGAPRPVDADALESPRSAGSVGRTFGSSVYGSSAYLESCTHLGTPRFAGGGAWLSRALPGSSARDLTGAYPLWHTSDPEGLAESWSALAADHVCAVAVVDPLLAEDFAGPLSAAFSDGWRPFKRHYLVDLDADFEAARSKHHRQAVRRASRRVRVERAEDPSAWTAEWCALYAQLRERLGFAGAPADFSDADLAAQLRLPGARYWRALAGEECVAASLWLEADGVTAYHLSAASSAARSTEAPYGLMDAALGDAADRGLRLATLGGAAGLADDPNDGLAYFKSGWSTRSAPAFLGAKVLQPERYRELSAGRENTTFFPAYRA